MAAPAPPEDPNEPFSHSVFLDLLPAPHSAGDGVGDDLTSSSDDSVLPFIRRMLLEEDSDDDNILHYRDHPALLQAELPFAQILSGSSDANCSLHKYNASAATTTESSVSGWSWTGSASAITNTTFADATWPYDPDELSQLLLSVSSIAGAGLQQSAGEETSAFSNGGGTGLQSSCFFQSQDGAEDAAAGGAAITMDMLNQAFLRGMEEANKFLPRDGELPRVLVASNQSQRQRVVDRNRMPILQGSTGNGTGRVYKTRHSWEDDLEAEAESGRRSKLMAPEPEGSGEVGDGVILKGYEVTLQKMQGLSISTSVPVGVGGGEEESNSKPERRQRSGNEAVDLRTLLIYCAEAVSAGNRLSAAELLRQISERSSPTGDASQRLAHYFAQGLELRLAGTGVAMPKHTSASGVELLKAYLLYTQVCCFRMVAFMFSHMAISKAVAGRKKVHIVDYGVHLGFHWLLLLGSWAAREGGPPEVRITGIDFPQPGFRPAARIEETGCRLNEFARRHGISFKFRSIVATKWEMVSAQDLNIEPDEVLVVNGMFHFRKLMDEGVIDLKSPSPRDMVLVNIQKMLPDVFILCVENSSYNAPFFVTRFREALFYYSAMFDMMDTTAPRDSIERMVVEQEFLGRCALNAIACEGAERVERPETYKQWQVRCRKVGLRQLPLNPSTTKCLSKRVEEGYHRNFVLDEDQQWLLQGWKGRILYAMSTWAADR